MIKVILWDIDGTLLDFHKAEHAALKKCFETFGLGPCTDEMIGRYSVINRRSWERLEQGKATKKQVLVERFNEFFQSEGIVTDCAEEFNQEYQIRLGDTIIFLDEGDCLLRELKGKVKQYAVTNGTQIVQKIKLERSGLDKVLEGAFISDEIGVEKPGIEFFQHVWKHIGEYEKDEIMIVGDSLSSDMLGGNRAGIVCCWYNPRKIENTTNVHIDYEIDNLQNIKKILNLQ